MLAATEALPMVQETSSGFGRTVTRVYWVAPRRIYIMFASAPSSPETDAHLATFLNSLKLRRK